METSIFIEGEFVQLNDYIRAERANKYEGARIKHTESLRAAYACFDTPPVSQYPVSITFTWIRKDRRADPDNVSFAAKFILDGMVRAGILKDDGMHEIARISHEFTVDKHSQGVRVTVQA